MLRPPLSNKFDLEVGQRSPSRSRHGTTGKVLSQGTHMPSIKALSVIVQKLWPRLKFLWQTDRQTDRRMRFNVPTLSRKRGTKTGETWHIEIIVSSITDYNPFFNFIFHARHIIIIENTRQWPVQARVVENEWKKLPHRQKYKHSGSIPRNAFVACETWLCMTTKKVWLSDRQTCFAGHTKMIYSNNRLSIYEWCEFEGTRTCIMLNWNETFLFYVTVQDVSVIFDKLWQHIYAQAVLRRRWTYDRVPMQ